MSSLRESRRTLFAFQGFYGCALDLRQSQSFCGSILDLGRLGKTTKRVEKREAGELSCCSSLARSDFSPTPFLSLSLSLSLSFSSQTSHALSPSLSPSLSLSLSLGGHVWNHLVSQKAGQNGKKDKCNARSAKRGERGRRQRENINNYVQCLQLEELSSESEPISAPTLQF